MTIIAYKDGTMCADSVAAVGQILTPVAFPKILRLPDGRLIGASGYAADCWAVFQWFLDGEVEKRPEFIGGTRDDEVDVLMARTNGTLWRNARGVDGFYPQTNGSAIGSNAGAIVAETAMRNGLSVEDAVALAIEMVGGLRGPVQVERLRD